MKLVDEIVMSSLSLVKTRVEFSIELYRNVGKVIEISRSFSFKHKSILLRMLEKIYYSQFFSKTSNLTDIIYRHLKNLAEFSPKRSIFQTTVPIIWTKTLTLGSMNGEKKYTYIFSFLPWVLGIWRELTSRKESGIKLPTKCSYFRHRISAIYMNSLKFRSQGQKAEHFVPRRCMSISMLIFAQNSA